MVGTENPAEGPHDPIELYRSEELGLQNFYWQLTMPPPSKKLL
jgi:hypothetical protein